jgi:hypothetical protein
MHISRSPEEDPRVNCKFLIVLAGTWSRTPMKKEVYITPTTITFRTQHPLRFKVDHLTPSTIQYRVINPLSP